MPTITIIDQPSTSAIKAAYRPIVFIIEATRTDGNPKPPIVFCDVYFNNVYYKTTAKTQYTKLNSTNSEWRFDIQDICQEILSKTIPPNGDNAINGARNTWENVFCKFRSSGIDSDGFTVPDPSYLPPIQGTGTIAPVNGGGVSSNIFFVINATLQHHNNQNLATHLDSFKQGNWDADVFPLTHRPKANYPINLDESDFYPIFSKDKRPYCLTLKYRNKGQNTFHSSNQCGLVTPVEFIIITDGDNCSDQELLNITVNGIPFDPTLFPMPLFKRKVYFLPIDTTTIDIETTCGADLTEGETRIKSGAYNQTVSLNSGGTGVMTFLGVPVSNTIYITYYSSTC